MKLKGHSISFTMTVIIVTAIIALVLGLVIHQALLPTKPTEPTPPKPSISTPSPEAAPAIKTLPQTNPKPPKERDEAPIAETIKHKPIVIPKELNIGSQTSVNIEGPSLPSKNPVLKTPDKTLLKLPNQPSPSKEPELLYGYEGKEEDKIKVNLGVSQSGVKLESRLKTDPETKEVTVEGVQIQIDLPK